MSLLPNIFGDKDKLIANKGILNQPGDKLEARITNSDRKVVKVSKNKGKTKYSATEYPNGTKVETKVTKK